MCTRPTPTSILFEMDRNNLSFGRALDTLLYKTLKMEMLQIGNEITKCKKLAEWVLGAPPLPRWMRERYGRRARRH